MVWSDEVITLPDWEFSSFLYFVPLAVACDANVNFVRSLVSNELSDLHFDISPTQTPKTPPTNYRDPINTINTVAGISENVNIWPFSWLFFLENGAATKQIQGKCWVVLPTLSCQCGQFSYEKAWQQAGFQRQYFCFSGCRLSRVFSFSFGDRNVY